MAPWGVTPGTGAWGRSAYAAVATPCLTFAGFRSTLRAHCDGNDIPAKWRALCATNCTACAAAGGAWTLGPSVSYDAAFGNSALSDRTIEHPLTRAILGAFYTARVSAPGLNAMSLCLPAAPGDVLGATSTANSTDAALAAQVRSMMGEKGWAWITAVVALLPAPLATPQVGVRRFSWPSSILAARVAAYSSGALPAAAAGMSPSAVLTIWGGHPLPATVCTLCAATVAAPVVVQVRRWGGAGVRQTHLRTRMGRRRREEDVAAPLPRRRRQSRRGEGLLLKLRPPPSSNAPFRRRCL